MTEPTFTARALRIQMTVFGLLAVCGCQTTIKDEPPAKIEQSDEVEILVAAKDLPVGFALTRHEVPSLFVKKRVGKDSAPHGFIAATDELLNTRLMRALEKDQPITLAHVVKPTAPPLGDLLDLITIESQPTSARIAPGDEVDILVTTQFKGKLLAFHILIKLPVVDVQEGSVFDPTMLVTVGVNQQQALIHALAKKRGCRFQTTKWSKDSHYCDYEIERVIRLLSDVPQELPSGELTGIAPEPRQKPAGPFLPEGTELFTFPASPNHTAGFLTPGSRIDVLGVVRVGKKLQAFAVVIDVLVVGVDCLITPGGNGTQSCTVSIAVKPEQGRLLRLARERECVMEPLLLAPGKKPDPEYDAKKVEELIRAIPSTAPAPRAKGD